MIKLIGAINSYWDLRDICRKYSGSCRNCPLGKEEDIMDTHCPRLTEPRSWSNEKNNRYGWKDWRSKMIVAKGCSVEMKGPMFLLFTETGMVLKAAKENLIEEHGEKLGNRLFKGLIEIAMKSEEQIESEDKKINEKISEEERNLLDDLMEIICMEL